MKRVAEYKIVFCIIAGLMLTLPAMARSLTTGVSTVAEAVSSSEYSLERLTGMDELQTTKTPSVITNNGTVVTNVTIPEEVLYDDGVEILDDSPWIVKGVEDPVAEGVADRKEYIVDSVFPYGLDNGPELNNIFISTYALEIFVGYSSSGAMSLPDIYTGDFDDGEVDDFLLKSIGCAIWAEVLTQEDKEEYVRIEEKFRMATAAEDSLYRTTANFNWRYREIWNSVMNNIFEDNTCWHKWVYDPERTNVQFKLGVDEETFTNDPDFQSLSEEKQEKFLELWQKANVDYKEAMLFGCEDEFGGAFLLYVSGGSMNTATRESKVNDSSSSLFREWSYGSKEFMANVFSRFGAEEGYTYVYDYDEDTGEITRYQAELKEIEGYLLPDNPVLDE